MVDCRLSPVVAPVVALVIAGLLATGSLATAGAAAGFDRDAPATAHSATVAAQETTTGNDSHDGNESTPSNDSHDANESRDASGVILVDRNGTEILRAYAKLNCSTLRVTVTPERYRYALRLTFAHEETGRRVTRYVGPLNGSVTDPFGRTPYDLLRVDLRVFGRPLLSRSLPERCAEPVPTAETAN